MTTATETSHLKRTPLFERHVALGGKMVDFGGFELPIQYTSILQEHEWVRSQCGVFDVSHLGEVKVTGLGAFPFIQKMIPTDLGRIGNNEIMYSVLLNKQGGLMDDILVYRIDVNHFYLVINASSIDKVMKHLNANKLANVEIENISDETACIAIQGPKAAAVTDKILGGKPLPSTLGYYRWRPLPGWGKAAWISRTGYTGEDGFEIFCDNKTAVKAWGELVEKGRRMGVKPIGLGARNTLRLEAGNGLYGTDFDETRTPYEARLQWLVDETKGDFFGKKILLERRKTGFRHRLCGFRVAGGEKAVPREGYSIYKGTRKVGVVTSGSYSPSLKLGIGLGHVEAALSNPNTMLEVQIHERRVPVQIVKLPFVPLKHK